MQPEPEPAMPGESEELKGFFEEKTGHPGVRRAAEAEAEAARIATAYAKNRGHTWASLRASLADYPSCLLRCAPPTARWTPCPSVGLPTVPCARASAWCGGRSLGRRR